MNPINMILAGVGGQGIVTAGILIGNAVTAGGLNATMSEIHGMSQRGGVVTVDLRIGDIQGPIVPEGDADLILGFEAVETLRVLNRAGMGATVIMNTERIVPVSVTEGESSYPDIETAILRLRKGGVEIFPMNAQTLAKDAGNVVSSNVVLVGAAYSAGFIPVSLSTLRQSARDLFPANTWGVNMKALESGMREYRTLRERSDVVHPQTTRNVSTEPNSPNNGMVTSN